MITKVAELVAAFDDFEGADDEERKTKAKKKRKKNIDKQYPMGPNK